MLKNLTTIIAGALIAFGAAGPAMSESNSVPQDLDTIIEILNTLQAASDDLEDTVNDLKDAADASENLLLPKTIFVTSTSHTGDFGGLAGADAICQGLADGPSSIVPSGVYWALLSTENVNAIARATPTNGAYLRSDGAIVAADFAALFSTADQNPASNRRHLVHPVNKDETGGDVQDDGVWTGSSPSGTGDGNYCASANGVWTDDGSGMSTAEGGIGLTLSHDEGWIGKGPDPCFIQYRLYCVQR